MTYMPSKISREWVDSAIRRVEIAYKDRRLNPGLSHEIALDVLKELLERLTENP